MWTLIHELHNLTSFSQIVANLDVKWVSIQLKGHLKALCLEKGNITKLKGLVKGK